ncbi:MAG TPA: hypothetical protein VHY10_01620 [Xanthobacteraceae bacterium]|nr:hypothetical protein [Xanthobacteraceae bacterium]
MSSASNSARNFCAEARARASGKPFRGGALPELDLDLLLAIVEAAHGAAAVGAVAFERRGRLRRSGRREHEAETERAQIQMQVVLVLEQGRDLILVAGRDQLRLGKCPFQILDDVVALDVHGAVMHQNRHQPARIDAEKPRLHVLMRHQFDRMRLPRDAFEVEKDAQFLRARRARKVQHMDAFPAEHFAGLDVAVDELNHGVAPALRFPHLKRPARLRQDAFCCARGAALRPAFGVPAGPENHAGGPGWAEPGDRHLAY